MEMKYIPNSQTFFVIVHYELSLPIVLVFNEHNSLPLGPEWALITFYLVKNSMNKIMKTAASEWARN